MNNQLRQIPQIQTLLTLPALQDAVSQYGHEDVVAALRDILAQTRAAMLSDDQAELPAFSDPCFTRQVTGAIEAARAPSLVPAINATGIIIHTNLGRARLAPQALEGMHSAGAQPSNLELDLATGKRGSRHSHVERLICDLTGAEAAVVVNNCAAAVLLSLMATAQGRSVVASRGELIEIGGAFRLPDVIAQSGAHLVEVGATNKTRTDDYAAAIDDTTAVLLKSHTSNFKIVGFTAAPDRRELAALARDSDVILMEDLGSGVLIDLAPFGLPDEPVVADILKSGVDLVMFSGDKLLGGPQSGIIAGRRDIVAQLKAHPLMRAVRIDKLSLAALEATLRLYRAPHDPVADVPVLAMLAEPLAQVEVRAQRLAQMLGQIGLQDVRVCASIAYAGAGSLPDQDLQSFAVAITIPEHTAKALSTALRTNSPPVIGRISREEVMLDMRTVQPDELAPIVDAMRRIARS